MVRTASSHKLPTQKDIWNEEDDMKIRTYGSRHGKGLRRSGKGSKQKWNDEKKPDPKHKSFSPQEEELVIKLHAAIGSRWPIIAQQLPGRSDNDVKILWNSKLRKKLSAMGIDPVTHRPFSQILADYGNIGVFPISKARFNSLSCDLKNNVIPSQDQSQNHPQYFSNYSTNFSTIQLPENNNSMDLYSQIQAINLVSEASNYKNTECNKPYFPTSSNSTLVMNQEMTSFLWSDFLLEDAFFPQQVEEQNNKGIVLKCEGVNEENQRYGDFEEKNRHVLMTKSFEGAKSSSNSSFVESMIESQDEVFPEFPYLHEEPFCYYAI